MDNIKEKKKYPFANPIVEIYRGKKLRRYNTIKIRVNSFEYKRFIDAKLDFGLSERKAIKEKNLLFPCNPQQIIPVKSIYGKGN